MKTEHPENTSWLETDYLLKGKNGKVLLESVKQLDKAPLEKDIAIDA